jgi:bifunctional non-homologous end joining protein LigD
VTARATVGGVPSIFLKPMAATLRAEPPADADTAWQWEVKWDGMRALLYVARGVLRIESRTQRDVTAGYPELAPLAAALGDRRAVLDGELVALDDDGRPSFQRLQARFGVADRARVERLVAAAPVTLMLFDLLWLDGEKLVDRPLHERRAALEQLGLDGERWRTPAVFDAAGPLIAETKRLGLEGVIGKRLDSTYQPGRRSPNWIKVKNLIRQEVVVAGWVPGEGRREDRIGALVIGVHDGDGALRYAGRVGTGFDDAELRRLAELLAPLRREDSPFTGEQPPRSAIFAEPRLVAEIAATEWTRAGTLRHPSYKGLREDKPAAEVVRETPQEG